MALLLGPVGNRSSLIATDLHVDFGPDDCQALAPSQVLASSRGGGQDVDGVPVALIASRFIARRCLGPGGPAVKARRFRLDRNAVDDHRRHAMNHVRGTMDLRQLWSSTSLVACSLVMATSAAWAADVTRDRLINADRETGNWMMVHRTYDAHRYSPLNQINKDNVANLRLAFVTHFDTMSGGGRYLNARNENTPLVEDGFMYVQPAWSKVYKVDVRDGRTGKIVWKWDPEVDRQWVSDATCCGAQNRGMAMWGNAIIALMLDGRVVSLNKDTGEVNWEKLRVERDRAESFTTAPLVIHDTAIYGPAGGEYGIRAWLEALNLRTGEPVWRTHLIPGPGEPGHDTWKRART
jgi:alcohol dehydrogenase (cytochrome c)